MNHWRVREHVDRTLAGRPMRPVDCDGLALVHEKARDGCVGAVADPAHPSGFDRDYQPARHQGHWRDRRGRHRDDESPTRSITRLESVCAICRLLGLNLHEGADKRAFGSYAAIGASHRTNNGHRWQRWFSSGDVARGGCIFRIATFILRSVEAGRPRSSAAAALGASRWLGGGPRAYMAHEGG